MAARTSASCGTGSATSPAYDCVVLPGGFAYGDYLRTGAIASLSPVMESVVTYAERGGLVFGSCNGFQILCEAGMLPGALLRNDHLEFRNEWTHLRVENADTPFTRACAAGDALGMPVSHGEGRYFADPKDLVDLELNSQVFFPLRYANGGPPRVQPHGSSTHRPALATSAQRPGMMRTERAPPRSSAAPTASDLPSILGGGRRMTGSSLPSEASTVWGMRMCGSAWRCGTCGRSHQTPSFRSLPGLLLLYVHLCCAGAT